MFLFVTNSLGIIGMSEEAKLFVERGKLEYPIRSIHTSTKHWEITDVETGKILSSVLMPHWRRPELVLDGDHILTEFYKISSISEGEDIQEVVDMKEFLNNRPLLSDYFTWLPAAEKQSYYRYSWRGETGEVFDPERTVRRLVVSKAETKKIGVWKWSGRFLEKEYDFEFKKKVRKVIALPKKSQILGGDEIAILFSKAIVIFDVSGRRRLRRLDVRGLNDMDIFILDGKLFLYYTVGVGIVSWHAIADLTSILGKDEQDFAHLLNVTRNEVSRFLKPQILLIFKTPKGYLILSFFGSGIFHMKEINTLTHKERFETVKIKGDMCSFPLHGADIGYVSTKRKLVIMDLSSKNHQGEFRRRQTLNITRVHTDKVRHLPGDRYLLETEEGVHLVTYNHDTGKYSLGPLQEAEHLLPISKEQRRTMENSLNDLIPPVVPREIVGVISRFI